MVYHYRRGQFDQALRINPRYAPAWIDSGLAAEIAGNYADAERRLLEAARVDRRYRPRWTLANFYLRRNRMEDYWAWVRKAAEVRYADRTSLYELCWQVTADGGEILRRGVAADVPYLRFLLRSGRLEAADAVANRVTDQNALHEYVERQLEGHRMAPALRLASARGLAGFDWQYPAVEGATASPGDEWSVRLSGKQPELVDVARKAAPLEGASRLVFAYRTENLAPETGLRWAWIESRSGRTVEAQWLRASEAWTTGSLTASGQGGAHWIVLRYERPSGQARAQGAIYVKDARVERVE